MAVNPGNAGSSARKEIARAMNTIAIVASATNIGVGGTAGGMYNAAKNATPAQFTALYNQTRADARDLLEFNGANVNFNTFLDTRSKLNAVASQLKSEFLSCQYNYLNRNQSLPATWGARVCSDVPAPSTSTAVDVMLDPVTGLPVDPMTGRPYDSSFLTNEVLTDEASQEDEIVAEGLSTAAKVGIGVGAVALFLGVVAIARR
jgi:hypothetical protein